MKKALFNISKLVSETEVPIESSFLLDFDYTCRKLNEYKPHYSFKKVDHNSEYTDTTNGRIDYILVSQLPEPCEDNKYDIDSCRRIYVVDNQYYICVFKDGKPTKTYKPSSLNCLRQMYYQIIGADVDEESSKTSDFYGICESGTDRHERIQEVIKNMQKMGVDCEFVDVSQYVKEHNLPLIVLSSGEYETKLFDEKRNLVFLCDGIIQYKKKYYILEIKTESSYKWMSRTGVDPNHKLQSFAYSLELQIPDILFVYENRDICTKKCYHVIISDEDRSYISDRLEMCESYVKETKVPPKEETVSSKICQYCAYRSVCKKDKVTT